LQYRFGNHAGLAASLTVLVSKMTLIWRQILQLASNFSCTGGDRCGKGGPDHCFQKDLKMKAQAHTCTNCGKPAPLTTDNYRYKESEKVIKKSSA